MSPAIANGPADAMTAIQPSPSQAEAPPLLTLRGVSKRFGVVQALAAVDLDIRAGEVLALVGENGAGKSTMMRIVEGVVSPDSGALAFDGIARNLKARIRCSYARRSDHPSGT